MATKVYTRLRPARARRAARRGASASCAFAKPDVMVAPSEWVRRVAPEES